MRSVDEYYLVKYVNADDIEFKEVYFTTYIHRDAIPSYLTILKTKDIVVCNRTKDCMGLSTFKNIVDIYFNPATNEDEYNVIIVLVENDD